MAKALPPPLSTAQFEVMNVLWERGASTISEVWQALAARRKLARATVQTVMMRLETKGWLDHREVGQAFLFSAKHSREAAQAQMIKDLIDRAFGGAADGLVQLLLSKCGVSNEELRRIRHMFGNAKANNRTK